MDGSASLIFPGSRIKLVPQAITSLAFLLPLGLFWFALIFSPMPIGFGGAIAFVLLTLTVAFLLWNGVSTLLRIANPNTLRINVNGLEVTTRRRKRFYAWSSLGEPEIKPLLGGSADAGIVIPLNSGWPLTLAAQDYAHRITDIIRVLHQARAGTLEAMPARPSNALYKYLAIPASIGTVAIVTALGIGLLS